jgi:hypothetical protein
MLEVEKRRFEVEDKPFGDAYTTLSQKHMNATATNSEESYMMTINNEINRTTALAKDHFERSIYTLQLNEATITS